MPVQNETPGGVASGLPARIAETSLSAAAPAVEIVGGLGGGCARIRDIRLVERAIREHWPIPRALRKPLIERLARIVQDEGSTPREATSAAKAILAASKLNLDGITTAIKAGEHEELRALVHELQEQINGST